MGFVYAALAVIVGIGLPLQVALNHMVAKQASALWSATISFTVGTIVLFLVVLLSRQPALNLQSLSVVPVYAWAGGLLGAFYVTMSIILAPKIGAATLVTLVIAGQLIASLVIDHYGFAGFPQQSISIGKLVGATLIVAGVVMIKRF